MALADSLRKAARNLIDTFGNTILVYTYSSATKTTNDEGEDTITSWGTGTSVPAVDGTNSKEILNMVKQGMESLGDDEKILRDDTAIAVNDRISADSINYRVTQVNPVRTQDTVIIYTITLARVDDITNW